MTLARPPIRECSSAVTTPLIPLARPRSSSSSTGLRVLTLTTRAVTLSFSSCPAASRAFDTMMPLAKMTTSSPSRRVSVCPIVYFLFSGKRSGISLRFTRIYTGPSCSAMALVIFSVSIPSTGTKTVMLGMALMMAASSTAWWVEPSPKSERPVLEPTILTLRPGMQIP